MKLAGYAALIQAYDLKAPLPARLSAISSKHKKYEADQWTVFTPKHNPSETLIGHLTFALKYEGVDLGILCALFHAIKKSEVLAIIADEPTGQYSRRIWFLYEWLMETQLDIPDISAGDYVDVLDDRIQFASASIPSRRIEGGFIGVHDRANTIPIPDHISARHQDILKLVNGLIKTDNKLSQSSFDPVLDAAIIAFGFVFIHPFQDGNGRIHRFLIHHVLAEMGFAPKGIVFPVSATILEQIDEYRQVLESYSKPRLSFMQWKPTASGNVEVTNETINLYRYFDATAQAEFLYDCVRQTIETNLPEEVMYLVGHDKMRSWIDDHFDMPDRQAELLISFLRQGQGKLSNRAIEKEFSALKEGEIKMIEAAFLSIFSL